MADTAPVQEPNQDRYGSVNVTPYELNDENDGLMNAQENEEEDEENEMSLQELLYSSSSYYAIAKPVLITMVLSALAVSLINDDQTRASGQAAMADAYEVWKVNSDAASVGQNLGYSLANALVMVSVICAMTFVIVLLYRMKCMKCLIGYMILCSGSLLGMLGGNLARVAINVYGIPVTKPTFVLVVYNFCVVGVLSIFWGQGIPKFITQGYLIATSVILAWHISFFDAWTTWALLFMLALYDLCAVLTPCGPLKALVDAMSQEDSPDMPGLLFEAELPKEATRPGVPKNASNITRRSQNSDDSMRNLINSGASTDSEDSQKQKTNAIPTEGPTMKLPLAIAKVYSLKVIEVPAESRSVMLAKSPGTQQTSEPLLSADEALVSVPENPTAAQLRAVVVVKLPAHGGRLEQVSRQGKKVYLERDRHGNPKRILWVDRNGKVFAEVRGDSDDAPENNSIRLGLGDFIFYSVLVAKAAQYSFSTFAACTLVILAGLGGTLVLLSVYHQALPALPISIIMGIFFYLFTRAFIQPWIEAVLEKPLYV